MWRSCRVKTGTDPSVMLKLTARGAQDFVGMIVLNILYIIGALLHKYLD